MPSYYCCTNNEDNDCSMRESCSRYQEAISTPNTTLYKGACTEENKHQLYIKGAIPVSTEENISDPNKDNN